MQQILKIKFYRCLYFIPYLLLASCGYVEVEEEKLAPSGSVTPSANSSQNHYYQPKAFTDDYQVEELFITKYKQQK